MPPSEPSSAASGSAAKAMQASRAKARILGLARRVKDGGSLTPADYERIEADLQYCSTMNRNDRRKHARNRKWLVNLLEEKESHANNNE